jgi:NADH-quinone oxidoreductase subunit A
MDIGHFSMEELLLSIPPFLVYGILVAAVVLVMLGSALLGERHSERATAAPYESGIVVTGDARIKFFSRFYLFAVFFVVFDIETIFLFTWSYVAEEMGIFGLIQAGSFVLLFLAALVYLMKMGALTMQTHKKNAHRPQAVSEGAR